MSVGSDMMAIMELLCVLIAAAVFAGTWLQAKASLTQLKELDAESVRTYNDIAEMITFQNNQICIQCCPR